MVGGYIYVAVTYCEEVRLTEAYGADYEGIVIFLPGIGKISSENINYLKEWISKGGTLVRFAGPNLVGSNNLSFSI